MIFGYSLQLLFTYWYSFLLSGWGNVSYPLSPFLVYAVCELLLAFREKRIVSVNQLSFSLIFCHSLVSVLLHFCLLTKARMPCRTYSTGLSLNTIFATEMVVNNSYNFCIIYFARLCIIYFFRKLCPGVKQQVFLRDWGNCCLCFDFSHFAFFVVYIFECYWGGCDGESPRFYLIFHSFNNKYVVGGVHLAHVCTTEYNNAVGSRRKALAIKMEVLRDAKINKTKKLSGFTIFLSQTLRLIRSSGRTPRSRGIHSSLNALGFRSARLSRVYSDRIVTIRSLAVHWRLVYSFQ